MQVKKEKQRLELQKKVGALWDDESSWRVVVALIDGRNLVWGELKK